MLISNTELALYSRLRLGERLLRGPLLRRAVVVEEVAPGGKGRAGGVREARARAGGVWRRARGGGRGACSPRAAGDSVGAGATSAGGPGAAAHLEPPLSAHGIALSRFFMYGNGTSSWSWWPCMKCFPIVTTPNTTTTGKNTYEYFFHCDVASARAPRERVAPLSTGGRGAGGRRRRGGSGAGGAHRWRAPSSAPTSGGPAREAARGPRRGGQRP